MSIPSTRAPSNIPFLKHSQPHANISRLVFPNLIVESALEVDASWDLFVEHLTLYRDKLPALKEFCVLTSFRWPINHFEYEYFALTPLIDDLHALGITFMDSSGTQWTRFEPVRKRWSRKRVLQLRPAMTENQESAGISLDE
ncbi:hypothetical protein OH76DRAFT_1014743 [Lentinus brumalis]|uniref:Uncharacterized protein n=1 Tax=Lentinus brumalis TaxID=2498619 RepID=A0A371CXX9_9APHY|nr:hypothetical protein OH76DRAFT_1014743 [Polyporus brumalis]